MEEQQAKNLIEQTFNNKFNKEQYAKFAMNLLDGLNIEKQFTRPNAYIKESFRPYIESYGRIGKYIDSQGNDFEVLWVNLKKETALDRARTMQRNFIAWYLNGGVGDVIRHNALVAFYNEEVSDWRFSFVKLEADLTENEKGQLRPINNFTAAKRYSFLVGEQEPNHTAQARLVDILAKENPVLSDIEEAFNIEKVSKEFFATYKELFLQLVDNLKEIKNNEPDQRINHEFVLNNITEANFCKKLMGQLVFLYFLQKKGWLGVKRGAPWGNGDKKFLRSTFEKAVAEGKNFFNDYLEPLFYEALANGERDENWFRLLDCKIPFLNGGLFEPIGVKIGGYDWVNTDIIFDNKIFSNDTKTKDGDIGDGILDVFDRYNFTVKEDEPLEKEVAIDPEMLGKVFEELLEVEDRKSKGAFYTPREIVHYMCQESLINYLITKLENNVEKQAITDFVHHADKIVQNEAIAKAKEKTGDLGKTYDYQLEQSIRCSAKEIDAALENIKICDPAVGSGAFPVGMMNEIIRVRMALLETEYIEDKYFTFNKEKLERNVYNYKRIAIQNSIYGVDIDCGAIEIAKLRLWLSLVVDENDIDEIKPLPNLDYKIVCGNSLLGVEKNLFNQFYFEKLEKLKPKYFDTTQKSEKRRLKKEIDEIISELTKDGSFDYEIYFSEVFHEKGGFDVIIANPPYVSHDKINLKDKGYFKQKYSSFEAFADLYCYFIDKGINLQNDSGLICFITSNSYLKAEYGKNLRNFIIKENKVLTIINIEDYQIFDSAIVNTAILITQKTNELKNIFIVNEKFTNVDNFEPFLYQNRFYYEQDDLKQKAWSLITPQQLTIKKKIEKAGTTLERLNTKIRLGIATGDNNAFIIDEEQRKEFIKADSKNSEIIKPILRGRDIQRYCYNQPGLHVLLTKNGINVEKDYPTVFKHLDSFGEKFKKRGARGQHWTNLRACSFFDDFKLEKIIWIELADKGRFSLCTDEIFLVNSAYFLLPPTSITSKYLLGILNSTLIQFYLELTAETSGMGTTRWINNHVKEFPISIISLEKQTPLINIVDKIIVNTQSEDYMQNQEKQNAVKEYEEQINLMVYKLYKLDYFEVLTIDPDFQMSEQDYSKFQI